MRSPRLSNAADPVCDTRSRIAPDEETYAALVVDHVVRQIGQAVVPCNWLQCMENSADPVHTEYLHGRHDACSHGPPKAEVRANLTHHIGSGSVMKAVTCSNGVLTVADLPTPRPANRSAICCRNQPTSVGSSSTTRPRR